MQPRTWSSLLGNRSPDARLNAGLLNSFVRQGAGDDMVIDGMYLALGVVVLSVAFYGWHRSKQRRLAAIRLKLRAKAEAGIDPFDDGFYCIMFKDGTCRSGYIERPPAE